MPTHQALARKWRPSSFEEVVGQAPVVQALINSLTQNRLHHAYLFTGTHGVGKTSIARLFAKSLNCIQGVTAHPCGQCSPCLSIDQGQSLDLIEVDAASRTKVEDTRELLENVQYAPTQGQYKIYLIDEVHMLSNHSFNALLKTLEEPPEHVKFLLATTDPQKLPVTVLSRCLQLHLKNLSAEQITAQLKHILESEQFPYEAGALDTIAHAAQGSMRDALSLLDQAIGHGNGSVHTADVKNMLGATEPELLLSLLSSLLEQNASQILSAIETLALSGADFHTVLEEFLSLLHQITLLQAVPALAQTPAPFRQEAATLATRLSAEDVQLYYQIGLIGRRDLPLAPTPRSGFEMVLLRMLAFHPERTLSSNDSTLKDESAHQGRMHTHTGARERGESTAPITAVVPSAKTSAPTTPPLNESWTDLLSKLNINGIALAIASHCVCTQKTNDEIHLLLDKNHATMLDKSVEQRIADALTTHFNTPIRLRIMVGHPTDETAIQTNKRRADEAQSQAITSLQQDTHLNELLDAFDARILPNSIQPLNEKDKTS